MKTHTFTLAAATAILAFPLAAQETKPCDADTMNMVMEQVSVAPDAIKVEAMAELDMAKEKMEAGDVETCSTHLTNAATLATTE